MPSKQVTELVGDHGEHPSDRSPSPSPSQPLAATKKPPKLKVAPQPAPSQQVLVICRNKHWRYISSFHGPWLQLPPEILETIANANYNTPRPRPIDPAVFFDLVKIRRLVDEATNLTVRAASGVASIGQRGVPGGGSHHADILGFGYGARPPPQTKLSAERRHRMREQATQKLMEAYWLDEIASSVATMQSASSLEEVASLVLQRNPHDADAKYVHFFHEKIPSRQLAECTSLSPINDMIAARPSNPAPLRTRAMVRIFKGDYQGAVDDLTEALKLHRLYRPAHASSKPSQESRQPENLLHGTRRRQEDVILKPEDQPSSLEMQLLFQRAGVYLAIACRYVAVALPADSAPATGHADGVVVVETGATERLPKEEPSAAEKKAQMRMAEARKLVRLNAKRALRDYTAYLSFFEYSPDLPIEVADDFARKVNCAVNGAKPPRSQSHLSGPRSPSAGEGEPTFPPHRVYALSDLFTSFPPAGLPPYPVTEMVPEPPSSPGPVRTTTEALTCHPLLTDALHALLLCHSLIQTSAKELLRHANMVARLTRLADGYPVFQSSRCPARADWIEVLRAGGNWIQLVGSWEDLCAPAPLPLFQCSGNGATPVPLSVPPTRQPKAPTSPGDDSGSTAPDASAAAPGSGDKQRRDRIHQQAVLDALGDDRVTDESTLRLAIRARQLRAEHDYRLDNAAAALDAKFLSSELRVPASSPASAAVSAGVGTTTISTSTSTRRRAQPSSQFDDGRDYYPISSERASAITRWVTQAPPPSRSTELGAGEGGVRKRRKKPANRAVVGVVGPVGSASEGPVGGGGGLKGGAAVEHDEGGNETDAA
ncbi:hypothetical protein MYCTH_2049292 [Thermothelomyces thermophilus ATCC 42464]|uniref:Histidine kinase group protein n=1 Tax=Thermothelomyces thermophilus (strain ATCC 42464 / BCRC 31852 / DSM 1799) TaxID=573729 RepID=G2Q6J4_THET4|nr:uncharacterized protein MYCTH_2049292 [Thermothelomyces thermophilus ATCC 42464]AEO55567.1 hypothetical protein MYCTH_2049292 [Thermothelomyces thermophilus ATCC 42464]